MDYIIVYNKSKKSVSCEKRIEITPRLNIDLLLKNKVQSKIGWIEMVGSFEGFGVIINKI